MATADLLTWFMRCLQLFGVVAVAGAARGPAPVVVRRHGVLWHDLGEGLRAPFIHPPTPQQLQLTADVAKALAAGVGSNRETVLPVEAPTGFGKTAVLAAAIHAVAALHGSTGRRLLCLISTVTIQQAKQLADYMLSLRSSIVTAVLLGRAATCQHGEVRAKPSEQQSDWCKAARGKSIALEGQARPCPLVQRVSDHVTQDFDSVSAIEDLGEAACMYYGQAERLKGAIQRGDHVVSIGTHALAANPDRFWARYVACVRAYWPHAVLHTVEHRTHGAAPVTALLPLHALVAGCCAFPAQ